MIIHKEQIPYTDPQTGQQRYKLVVSYINKQGNVSFLQYPIPPESMFEWKYATRTSADPPFYEYDYDKNEYKLDENGNMIQHQWMSYDKKFVRRVPTDKPLSDNRLVELLESFGDKVAPVFEMNYPNTWYCDIEVEVTEDGFPEPEQALTPITTISMTKHPQTIVWATKPLESESDKDWIQQQIDEYSEKNVKDERFKDISKGYKFEFRCFPTEKEMLEDFVKFITPIPSICGWNFLNFDWLYIYNRCQKNSVDLSCISPTRTNTEFKLTPRSGGATIKLPLPMHKMIWDYLLVIKTWALLNLGDYKLDTLATHFLSLGKVEHSWDFISGYNKFYREYVFYNCIDTIILEQLHNEAKTANVWFMLSAILKIELNAAFSTIKPAETVMMVHEYARYRVFPSVKHQIPEAQEKYDGAFVWPSKPMIARYIGGLDFASLYPSIIRQFLISPETFKYKKDVNEYKPTDDEIMTASGAVYERKVDSMIPQILEKYYNMRKQAKGDMKTCEEEAEFLEEILERREKQAAGKI